MWRRLATAGVVVLWVSVAFFVIRVLPSTDTATTDGSPSVVPSPPGSSLTSAVISAVGRGGPMKVRISYGTIGQGNLLDETITRLPIEDSFLVEPRDDVWLTVKPVDPDRRVVCRVLVEAVGQETSSNRQLPWCRVRVRGWVIPLNDDA